MKTKNIVITEADYVRLQRLVDSSRVFRQRDAKHLDDLEQELERAAIMESWRGPERCSDNELASEGEGPEQWPGNNLSDRFSRGS